MPTSEQPAKIGKYEVLSTLGRGGMGVVYKARDPIIDRIVAVKTILMSADAEDDGLLERLHMEARSAGRLQHPNIVTVYDFGEQGSVSYIVMEYVEGVNLARVIDDHRQLPLAMKLSILIQIADGLAYAHEHGVVHRDMKPSNVCITERGTAKILDFGLARFDNTRLTKTGYMAGTISYMSPERLNGETGPHDDIFALGAIAYELLTYQRAFAGSMAPEVISKIIAPTLPPMPSQVCGVPAVLDTIVARALAKDVADRYASAAMLADDLRAALQSGEVRDYMTAAEQPTMDRPLQDFITRASINPYGTSSGKSTAGAPPPTLRVPTAQTATQIQTPATLVVSDVKTQGAHTQPEMTPLGGAATQIVPATKPSRAPKIAAGVGGAAVIVIAAFFAFSHRVEPPKPVPQKPKPGPVQPQRNPLADSSELQLATARNLTDALSHRNLTGDDLFHFTEARARIALAEKKLNEKDYESGGRLIADAITELEGVMKTTDGEHTPPITVVPNKNPEKKKPPVIVTAAPAPVPLPAPAPVQPPVVIAQPQPTPQPQPAPVQPAPQPAPAPDPEKQIAAFMRQLATAYQTKDVGFFREHAANFTPQLASAILHSPSVRVELQVERIDLRDPKHATVLVKRTDWFPDAGMQPAVQSLAYNIEDAGNGWQLVSISRR